MTLRWHFSKPVIFAYLQTGDDQIEKYLNITAHYVNTIEDLDRIAFVDGIAEVDVPIRFLDVLPLVGEKRPETERLNRLMRIIRSQGYGGEPRIVVQVDAKGCWAVIDGGHRITAARRIAKEFWTNIIFPKVITLHFILHQYIRSAEWNVKLHTWSDIHYYFRTTLSEASVSDKSCVGIVLPAAMWTVSRNVCIGVFP